MNDDRNFQKLAEAARILFENNIPPKIIAAVLNISGSTTLGYKKKVEEKYRIVLETKIYKAEHYSNMLEIYINLSNDNELNPAQEILLKAVSQIIEIKTIKAAIDGAMLFAQALETPRIMSGLSPRFKNCIKLLNEILPNKIFDPDINQGPIQNPMAEIMEALTNGRIPAAEIESTTDFINKALKFLAHKINREKIKF